MEKLSIDTVRMALQQVLDPEIRRPITELGMVDEITIDDTGFVTVRILLTVASCPLRANIESDVSAAVSTLAGASGVHVDLGVMNDAQRTAMRELLRGGLPERTIPFAQPDSLTHVIAVASGKGGVGKSSLTVNLALALAQLGHSVGVLDADIYGHSVPDLLGIAAQSPTVVDDMIMPVPAGPLRAISMGMLKQSRDQVIAWRGPILDRALTQFLTDVYWGDLDYLFIDLPPGTGDVALSIGQKLPNSKVIVVTTPQSAASEVSERAGTMAAMMNQQVIGVVENMSWFERTCSHCGKPEHIELFGSGGGQTVAETLSERLSTDIPLLGQIPFEPSLRAGGDAGHPIVESSPSSPTAKAIVTLAATLVNRLSGKPSSTSISH